MTKNIQILGSDGKKQSATIVEVEQSIDRWSDITLTDGTVLKAKPIIIDVERLDGEYDHDGNPVYNVKNQLFITVVSTPDDLKKR